MKNAYWKDILRSIAKGKKRFLAIAMITCLGVTMMTGIGAACMDLRRSADQFFDEQGLFDIRIVSTLGLTDEDLEALRKVDGVEEVYGGYSEDVYTKADLQKKTATVYVIGDDPIDRPYVTEGRMPEKSDEIAVTEKYLRETGKSIGDTLQIEEDTDDTDEDAEDGTETEDKPDTEEKSDTEEQADTGTDAGSEEEDDTEIEIDIDSDTDLDDEEEDPNFLTTEFTICGVVIDSADINSSDGACSFRSTSLTDYTFFVPEEAVSYDVYTAVYLMVSDASDLMCYSDAYNERIQGVVDLVDSRIKEERRQARLESIQQEADEKIDDAENTLEEELAKAKDKISDAREELSDGKQELLDGETEVSEAEEELQNGRKEYEDGKAELEDGEVQLADGYAQLKSSQEELNENKQKLLDAKKTLDENQAAIDASSLELSEGEEQLKEAQNQLDSGKEQLEEGRTQLEAGLTQLDDGLEQLTAGEVQLEEGLTQIDQGLSLAAENQEKLTDGIEQAKSGLDLIVDQLDVITGQMDEAGQQQEQISGKLEQIDQQLDLFNRQQDPEEQDTPPEEQKAALEEQKAALEEQKAALEEQKAALTEQQTALETQTALLESAKEALEEQKTDLEEQIAQLEEQETALEEQISLMEEQKTGLETQKAELEKQKEEAETQKEELLASQQLLDQQEEELAAGQQTLDEKRQELTAGKEQLAAGQAELDSGYEQVNSGLAQIADGEAQLEEGKAELDANKQKLEEGKAELLSALQELEDGEKQIADAKKELADGWADYEEGVRKLEDNEQLLIDKEEEARQKIADARADVEDIELPDWYIQKRASLSGFANVRTDADCIDSVAAVFPVIFFLVAILISLTTITRMVEEDRGLIGTYKALGYTDRKIRLKYELYAGSACIIGGLAGDILGFIVLPQIIFIFFGVMYELPFYHMSFLPLSGIGSILLFLVGILFTASWSCRMILKNQPAQLMRPKVPAMGSRVFLEYIRPLWRRMSFLNKVTARNLFRYKKRLFMTVFGIMGCVAILVCGFAIKDTVTSLMSKQYEKTVSYDLMLVGEDEESIEKALTSQDASMILNWDMMQIESVTVSSGGDEEMTIQMIVVPEDASLDSYVYLEDTDGNPLELKDGDVFCTRNVQEVLGIKDSGLMVQRLNMDQADLQVTSFLQNYLGNTLYMTRNTYESYFGEMEKNGALLCLTDECTDPVSFSDQLAECDGILSSVSVQSLKDEFSVAFTLINLVVYVLLVLSAGLAFTVLFTLSTTNISERERELATIKVLGFYDNEVHLYVNKETLILTGFGILLGLPLGTMIGNWLTFVLKMPSLYFDVSIFPVSYLYSAGLTILFAWIVNKMTDHSLNRINPAEALKSIE